jgi:hypothetical protein
LSFLTQDELRRRARRFAENKGVSINEALDSVARKHAGTYDVFLSQTIRDAEIVLGFFDYLTSLGLEVFCDWITAAELHREDVTVANAAYLRDVMGRSSTMLFLDTEGAAQSQWMCWEIGWFDANNGHVAVVPVLLGSDESYRGREFLGLYPYVKIDEDGELVVVRPSVTNRHGVTMIEAPNSTSYTNWSDMLDGDFMRPRNLEHWGAAL